MLQIRLIAVLIIVLKSTALLNAQSGIWTWMSGSSTANSTPSYGTQGVFSPSNHPGGLYEACEWTDASGNFWLFGGYANFASNVMWKYDVSLNQWAWITGTMAPNAGPVFGTMGIPSVNNTPSARKYGSMAWTDNNGNLWLFGGTAYDLSGNPVLSNDLWMFNPATYEWTWVRGSQTASTGNYGVQGVPSPTNEPAGRCESACTWVDGAGDLWMYGGENGSPYGDLWRYNIATNQWTFMSGGMYGNVPRVTGTIGVEAPGNMPGSRMVYARGIENGNYLYLFGGRSSSGMDMNDLWRYNISTGMWSCIFDSNADYVGGPYPESCEYFEDSKPDNGMEVRTCWSDSCGIWIFSGNYSNDIWHYEFGTDGFAFMRGHEVGNYGTITIPASTNIPPGRQGGVAWTDNNGDLWMFGGLNGSDFLNDLWRYQVDSSCRCSARESTPPGTEADSLQNVFTPNGDGVNDSFQLSGFQTGDRAYVYDRWGVLIYEFANTTDSWDGTFNGRSCSDGVYYYLFFDRDNILIRKGFVQLIR